MGRTWDRSLREKVMLPPSLLTDTCGQARAGMHIMDH